MSLVQDLRACLDHLLKCHADANGVGSDAYWPTPRAHPMADAKYLMAVGQCYKAGVIGQSRALSLVKPAAKRLLDRTVPLLDGQDDLLAWGLGFPWAKHGYLAQDPLLINTSIGVRALATLDQQGILPDHLEGAYIKSVQGLTWWAENETAALPNGFEIPCYGLRAYRMPVHNTAAYCLGTLQQIDPDRWHSVTTGLQHIAQAYHPGAGWVYAHDNPVIDLLHQWYILNPLFDVFGTDAFQEQARTVIGQFATGAGFLDVAVLQPKGWVPDVENPLGTVYARPVVDGTLVVKPKPARLWSLGEMLVGVSRLCRNHPDDPLWSRYGQMIAELILEQSRLRVFAEWHYPRHTMHIAHGLAAYIAFRRDKDVL